VGVLLEVESPGSVRGALDFTDRTLALYVIIEVLGEVETMMDFERLHTLLNLRLGILLYRGIATVVLGTVSTPSLHPRFTGGNADIRR
jgi:hypothetical protein